MLSEKFKQQVAVSWDEEYMLISAIMMIVIGVSVWGIITTEHGGAIHFISWMGGLIVTGIMPFIFFKVKIDD